MQAVDAAVPREALQPADAPRQGAASRAATSDWLSAAAAAAVGIVVAAIYQFAVVASDVAGYPAAPAVVVFATLITAAVSLAHRHPSGVTWLVPAVSWFVAPALSSVAWGDFDLSPIFITSPWGSSSLLTSTYLLADVAVVLAPAWYIKTRSQTARRPVRWDDQAVAGAVLAIGLCGVLIWGSIAATSEYASLTAVTEAPTIAITAIAAVLASSPRLRVWLPAVMGCAVAYGYAIEPQGWAQHAAVGAIVSCHPWLADCLRRLTRRSARAWVAANVLNVADAVLTLVWLSDGTALEANPVIRQVGMPAKVVFVALATWLLCRVRPSRMAWPITIFALVIAYHAAGGLFTR